jgi:hypothetical protein
MRSGRSLPNRLYKSGRRVGETPRIGQVIEHEAGQRFRYLRGDQRPALHGCGDVQSFRAEALQDGIQLRLCSDHNCRVAAFKSGSGKRCEALQKDRIVRIDEHLVTMSGSLGGRGFTKLRFKAAADEWATPKDRFNREDQLSSDV